MGSRQRRIERKLACSNSPDIISRVPEEEPVYRLTDLGKAYAATPEFQRDLKQFKALRNLAKSLIKEENRAMFAMFNMVIFSNQVGEMDPTLEELIEPTDVTESDARIAISDLRKIGLIDQNTHTLGPDALACLESLTYE